MECKGIQKNGEPTWSKNHRKTEISTFQQFTCGIFNVVQTFSTGHFVSLAHFGSWRKWHAKEIWKHRIVEEVAKKGATTGTKGIEWHTEWNSAWTLKWLNILAFYWKLFCQTNNLLASTWFWWWYSVIARARLKQHMDQNDEGRNIQKKTQQQQQRTGKWYGYFVPTKFSVLRHDADMA